MHTSLPISSHGSLQDNSRLVINQNANRWIDDSDVCLSLLLLQCKLQVKHTTGRRRGLFTAHILIPPLVHKAADPQLFYESYCFFTAHILFPPLVRKAALPMVKQTTAPTIHLHCIITPIDSLRQIIPANCLHSNYSNGTDEASSALHCRSHHQSAVESSPPILCQTFLRILQLTCRRIIPLVCTASAITVSTSSVIAVRFPSVIALSAA